MTVAEALRALAVVMSVAGQTEMAVSWLDLTQSGTTCLVTEQIPMASVLFETKSHIQNVGGICPSSIYFTRL